MAPPADAIPPKSAPCLDANELEYQIVGPWNGAQLEAFRFGAARWALPSQEMPKTWYPLQDSLPIQVNERPHGYADISAYLLPLAGDLLGQMGCYSSIPSTYGQILIRDGLSVPNTLAVSAHEAGHALGLNHTHGYASTLEPRRSLMSTCRTDSVAQWPSRDDIGQFTYAYGYNTGPTIGADFDLTNLAHWERTGSVSVTDVSGGRRGALLESSGTQASLSQSMVAFGVGGHTYKPWARYKAASTTNAGLTYKMERRQVTMNTAGPASCSFTNGLDLNSLKSLGVWEECSAVTNSAPSTSFPSGGKWSVPIDAGCTIPTSWHGAELRVSLYKNSTTAIVVDGLAIGESA